MYYNSYYYYYYCSELGIIRKQLQDKEQVEMKLLKANQTISVLQNQIDSYIEDKKITALSKKKIDNYENMVYRVQVLEQENSGLKYVMIINGCGHADDYIIVCIMIINGCGHADDYIIVCIMIINGCGHADDYIIF